MVETKTEIGWGFDDRGPAYSLQFAGSYANTEHVDPAPCYAHDEALVRYEYERLLQMAPLPMKVGVFVLSHELIGRTNAHYVDSADYTNPAVDFINRKGKESSIYPHVGYIVMSGKRIPPHPAMTRYLVAHEYGHAVQYSLDRQRDVPDGKPGVLEDYKAVRPDALRTYGCGKWHTALGELFANDFRILVAGREREFWPHAGFTHPTETPAAIAWWAAACVELGWTKAESI